MVERARRAGRFSKPKTPLTKGDVLAHVGRWKITCNEPGYSMIVQYDDGQQRFLTHGSAQALALAIIEAIRVDPQATDIPADQDTKGNR